MVTETPLYERCHMSTKACCKYVAVESKAIKLARYLIKTVIFIFDILYKY